MQSRTMRFLVIQHAACEPPGAYEDEMLARRIEFERVELDETRALPDWREFAAIVAMVQFHLEASPELAASWLEIREYAAELEQAHGEGAVQALAADLPGLEGAPSLARELFGRWIDRVVDAVP